MIKYFFYTKKGNNNSDNHNDDDDESKSDNHNDNQNDNHDDNSDDLDSINNSTSHGSNNQECSNSDDIFDQSNWPKHKNIKAINFFKEESGKFSKSENSKFYDLYDFYFKDIKSVTKEKTIKDANNQEINWKYNIGCTIIYFVDKEPKMLQNKTVDYATKDDIKEIKDTLVLIINRMDSMEANFKKEIQDVNNEIQDVKSDVAALKSDMVEVKKDISSIKQCPTIKKELSELKD